MKLSECDFELVTPQTKTDKFLSYLKLRFPNFHTRTVEDRDSWDTILQMKAENYAGTVEINMNLGSIDKKEKTLEYIVNEFEKLLRGEGK